MDKYSIDNPKAIKDDDLFLQIVGKTQAYKKQAMKNSVNKKAMKYGEKKRVNRDRAWAAVVSLVLAGSILLGVAIDKLGSKKGQVVGRDGISISTSVNEEIDEKIQQYFDMMNYTGKEGERIETAHSYNEKNHEANVSYNYRMIEHYIVDTASVSESENRCAILAMFKVINEPCRKETFDKVFASIAQNEELCETLPSYLTTGSWDGFLEALGYSDVSEYNMHEREQIKEVATAENVLAGNRR